MCWWVPAGRLPVMVQTRPNGRSKVTVITVENLHVAYGEKVAVDDISFAVSEGEIFGILGPNGAGKTTTVECIGGLRRAGSGRIDVLGLDPWRQREQLRE